MDWLQGEIQRLKDFQDKLIFWAIAAKQSNSEKEKQYWKDLYIVYILRKSLEFQLEHSSLTDNTLNNSLKRSREYLINYIDDVYFIKLRGLSSYDCLEEGENVTYPPDVDNSIYSEFIDHICVQLGLDDISAQHIKFICNEESTTSTTTSTTTTTTTTTTTPTTTTTTTTTPIIECDSVVNYEGGISYPTENIHNLGNYTGTVTLYFGAGSRPDRWIVLIDNIVYLDTGYVGETSRWAIGGVDRVIFNTSLLGKIDPVTLNVYPFVDISNDTDGYPIVIEQLFLYGTFLCDNCGLDYRCFSKDVITELVTVRTYAPLTSTGWGYKLSCPGGSCGELISTTSAPTTST